jgi:hypothetical protein
MHLAHRWAPWCRCLESEVESLVPDEFYIGEQVGLSGVVKAFAVGFVDDAAGGDDLFRPETWRGHGVWRAYPDSTEELDLVDFFDATSVAAAFEGGCEPDADDMQGLVGRDGALAEGEHVGVVVRAVPDRDLFIPA